MRLQSKTKSELALNHSIHFKDSVYLSVNGKEFLMSDPYLWIRKESHYGPSYFVKGIYGFGGLGWGGYMSTKKLVAGLNRLGFEVTAKQLREIFKEGK